MPRARATQGELFHLINYGLDTFYLLTYFEAFFWWAIRRSCKLLRQAACMKVPHLDHLRVVGVSRAVPR